MVHLGKWLIMIIWLGTPLVLANFGRYIIHDSMVIFWLFLGFVIALFPFFMSHIRICLYLEARYPDQFRKIKSYKKMSIHPRTINTRFDMLFEFSPKHDLEYARLKRNYKECFVFTIVSIIIAFCSFWYYVTI